jgi:Flp pilus assembly pilin Flp
MGTRYIQVGIGGFRRKVGRHYMLVAYIRARSFIQARLEREEGQALVEYALILSLIAVASVAILLTLGGKVAGIFTTISNSI